MIREVVISFEVDSLLNDNELCCAMDGAIELGLDRAIDDKKIVDYDFPSKNVIVRKIDLPIKKNAGIKKPEGQLPLHSMEQGTLKITVLHPQSKPLTDHAKYCRLSKYPGGLCGCRQFSDKCSTKISDEYAMAVYIPNYYSHCPYPEKQQPVELPKDPLEELCRSFTWRLWEEVDTITLDKVEKMFREFAEKVSAVNDNINPVNDNIIQSNDICDYCATVYGSITCRACQPVNGHSGFQGKTVRTLCNNIKEVR